MPMARKKNKKNNTTSASARPKFQISNQQKIIFGTLLMLLSVAFVIAFISYFSTWQQDQSLLKEFWNKQVEAENWLNKFGASVSDFFIRKGFGVAAFIFPILIFQTGLFLFVGLPLKKLNNRWFWGILSSIWLAIFFGFFAETAPILGGVIRSEAENWLNKFGASVSDFFIRKGFGVAAFIFPILIFQTGLFLFVGLPLKKLNNRWFWGILSSIWLAIFFGFFAETAPILGGVI